MIANILLASLVTGWQFVYFADVHEVYDGDTIADADIHLGYDEHVDGNERLRLLGVNTPEIRGKAEAVEKRGREARDWLAEQIEGERIIIVTDNDESDSFGRKLVVVYDWDDGKQEWINLNAQLIYQGFSKPYRLDSEICYGWMVEAAGGVIKAKEAEKICGKPDKN